MATFQEDTPKKPIYHECARCKVVYNTRTGGVDEKGKFVCLECYGLSKITKEG